MYATDRRQTDIRNVYVRLCTCLSVTRRCCVTVKTVKPILKQLFWQSGIPIILLFLPLASVPTSKGTPSAALVIGSGRIAIFGTCLVRTGHVAEMLDPHTPTGYGHYEHLKCVKTVWRLRAEISFASIEKNSTTGRRLRPGALLIIYINIVRGAKRLWGESSMGRNAHGAKHLWGEMSVGRKVSDHRWRHVTLLFCIE